MSLSARLTTLVGAIGAQIKSIKSQAGTLATLATAEKTSLVGAINELHVELATLASSSSGILDSGAADDASHTWSINKIVAELAALEVKIVNGAPEAFNTLIEISNKLTSEDSAIAGLLTNVGQKVSFAEVQGLTAPQKVQACENIGVGDPDVDLVAALNAAMA
jgi:hypothetical protein